MKWRSTRNRIWGARGGIIRSEYGRNGYIWNRPRVNLSVTQNVATVILIDALRVDRRRDKKREDP